MSKDDNDEDLEQFLQEEGDEFVSEEQRQEQLAKERRLARKRRLQLVAMSDDSSSKPQPQQQAQQSIQQLKQDPVQNGSTTDGILEERPTTNVKLEEQLSSQSDTKQQGQQQQATPPTLSFSVNKGDGYNDDGDGRNDNKNDDDDEEEDDDDDDEFDMFSSSVSPLETDDVFPTNKKKKKKSSSGTNQETSNKTNNDVQNVDQQQDWDDAEGYYKATIGEIIAIEIPTTTTTSGDDNHNNIMNNNNSDNNALMMKGDNNSHSNKGHNFLHFRVAGVIGKGVFSTVLKCTTEGTNPTSTTLPHEVALKCVRHNETMAKAAYNEIRFLQKFTTLKEKSNNGTGATTTTSNNNNNNGTTRTMTATKATPGIIPLLLPHNNVPLEFRGHTVLVFPYMEYNLRDVLTKFGKGVGLSLTAVRSYFGQLLAAATHLKQHALIHSDLKPDNILVSHDFSTVQLCDFGSAMQSARDTGSSGGGGTDLITPYLVSRFYRAPEIILGLIPTYAIDLWSLAVTGAELFLGNVLIQGKTNNDMIHLMMQHMGPVSNRLIRQHLVQTKRFPLKAHFQQEAANYVFRQETVDPVTGQAMHKNIPLIPGGRGFIPPVSASSSSGGGGGSGGGSGGDRNKYDYSSPKLKSKILKAKSKKDSRTMVLQFADLLQKCLTLDPTRRIAVKMALQHEFFQSPPTEEKS